MSRCDHTIYEEGQVVRVTEEQFNFRRGFDFATAQLAAGVKLKALHMYLTMGNVNPREPFRRGMRAALDKHTLNLTEGQTNGH